MEQYEIDVNNKRLVEFINHMNDVASMDIGEWLDSVPEVAKICMELYEETGDVKYKDILETVVVQLDSFLIKLVSDCDIDKKESYNLIRLKLKNIMGRI